MGNSFIYHSWNLGDITRAIKLGMRWIPGLRKISFYPTPKTIPKSHEEKKEAKVLLNDLYLKVLGVATFEAWQSFLVTKTTVRSIFYS